jgi:hypothetical protein
VDKVHCPVDGVDDPGRVVGELVDLAGGGRRLFADELVTRKSGSVKKWRVSYTRVSLF